MIKPQDIVLAVIMLTSKKQLTQPELSEKSQLSLGEVNNVIRRLSKAKIYDSVTKKIDKHSLLEFLIHGLKYVFPATLGAPTRGIATAWGHKLIKKHVVAKDTPVWSSVDGDDYGMSVVPIYKTVPNISINHKKIYEIFVAIDCIRIGKTREKAVAQKLLKDLIL